MEFGAWILNFKFIFFAKKSESHVVLRRTELLIIFCFFERCAINIGGCGRKKCTKFAQNCTDIAPDYWFCRKVAFFGYLPDDLVLVFVEDMIAFWQQCYVLPKGIADYTID